MKTKHLIIIGVLITIVVVCYIGMKKVKHNKLVERVRDAFGDIADLDKKSDAELQELLNSRQL